MEEEEDRLSGLPDDLLRCILTRVRRIRTSRPVPPLAPRLDAAPGDLLRVHFSPAVVDSIRDPDPDDALLLDRVDVAVAYSAVRLRPYPADRAAASLRLAGELNVEVEPEDGGPATCWTRSSRISRCPCGSASASRTTTSGRRGC